MRLKAGVLSQRIERDDKEAKPVVIYKTLRGKAWNFLENPDSSKLARAFAIFSFLNIFLSVVIACAETVSAFHKEGQAYWENPFHVGELYLNSWFLLELVARFLLCPNKVKFMKTILTLVDVIAVLPYFIIMAMSQEKSTSVGSSLRLLRFIRVLRLFRLSKHSAQIKAVGDILRDSFQDLYIFVLCLLIMTVFSGAILYFVELSHPTTQFISIPESMWWALQTVVTLGYGDITPTTILGKIYSAFFMVFGALTISLPVLSIVMKFTHMYSMEPFDSDQSSNNETGQRLKTSIRSRESSIKENKFNP